MGKRKLNPTIKLEKQIGEQIYNALQGSVVEEVLRKMKISSSDAYWPIRSTSTSLATRRLTHSR